MSSRAEGRRAAPRLRERTRRRAQGRSRVPPLTLSPRVLAMRRLRRWRSSVPSPRGGGERARVSGGSRDALDSLTKTRVIGSVSEGPGWLGGARSMRFAPQPARSLAHARDDRFVRVAERRPQSLTAIGTENCLVSAPHCSTCHILCAVRRPTPMDGGRPPATRTFPQNVAFRPSFATFHSGRVRYFLRKPDEKVDENRDASTVDLCYGNQC